MDKPEFHQIPVCSCEEVESLRSALRAIFALTQGTRPAPGGGEYTNIGSWLAVTHLAETALQVHQIGQGPVTPDLRSEEAITKLLTWVVDTQ